MPSALSEWKEGLLDVLFPPTCVHCGEAVDSESPLRTLCLACSRTVHLIRPPACSVCGHPFYGPEDDERVCPHCEGLVPAFDQGRSLVLFRGAARSLMLELKYRRGLPVLRDFASLLKQHAELCEWMRGASLVPVPMHPLKRRERGYNQTELIAEAFVRALGGELVQRPLLQRIRYSKSQTSFDRRARRTNLANTFEVVPQAKIAPQERILLLDDVFTTGSTLNRCAQALRNAGAQRIDVLTFGHG